MELGQTYNIYAVRNSITGRVYVGCAADVNARLKQHFRLLKRGQKTAAIGGDRKKSTWQEDYDRYGEASFDAFILQTGVGEDERVAAENYWIAQYKSNTAKHGYNLKPAIHSQPVREVFLYRFLDGVPPLPKESL